MDIKDIERIWIPEKEYKFIFTTCRTLPKKINQILGLKGSLSVFQNTHSIHNVFCYNAINLGINSIRLA